MYVITIYSSHYSNMYYSLNKIQRHYIGIVVITYYQCAEFRLELSVGIIMKPRLPIKPLSEEI